nr:hypothetical protein [Desulfosarcinaceae bacterium]
QKTLVISRGTLSLLQKMAETYDAPRDALVEMSIQRLKPVIAQEKAKLAQRKRIAAKVKNAVAAQRRLLTEASETLGPEDPLCDHLSCALERLESAHTAIAAFVQKSERVMALDL